VNCQKRLSVRDCNFVDWNILSHVCTINNLLITEFKTLYNIKTNFRGINVQKINKIMLIPDEVF
jgi:hypothetical protein